MVRDAVSIPLTKGLGTTGLPSAVLPGLAIGMHFCSYVGQARSEIVGKGIRQLGPRPRAQIWQ
jgi:hypothetical protein